MDFSKIIIGVMRWGVWGANHSVSEVQKLIETSLEEGFYTYDQADIYGGHTTEELFGNAFSEMGIDREKIQLISKCGICYPSEKKNYPLKYYNLSKDYIIASVEESLRNLKTDYLDVLLIHRPSPLMDPQEVAAAFGLLRTAGKVKDFGVSNFTPSQFNLLADCFPALITNQVEVSLTETKTFYDGTLDQLMRLKLKPMAYSVLGNYFTEDSERTARIASVFRDLCPKYNATEAQLLLAFLYKHPAGILPIIGTSKKENINSMKKAITLDLLLEDWFLLLEASLGRRVS